MKPNDPEGAIARPLTEEAGRADEGRAAPRTLRSARFTILADSEEGGLEGVNDYIILDIPPDQCEQVFNKVKEAYECSKEADLAPNTLIGVYLEVYPERQSDVGFRGGKEISRTYPPSLLRDDIDPPPAGPPDPLLAELQSMRAWRKEAEGLLGEARNAFMLVTKGRHCDEPGCTNRACCQAAIAQVALRAFLGEREENTKQP